MLTWKVKSARIAQKNWPSSCTYILHLPSCKMKIINFRNNAPKTVENLAGQSVEDFDKN